MNELKCIYNYEKINYSFCLVCAMDLNMENLSNLVDFSVEKLINFIEESEEKSKNNIIISNFNNDIEKNIFFMKKTIILIEKILKMDKDELENSKICLGNIFCFKFLLKKFNKEINELNFKKIYS